jgi:hypothetical protein
VAGVGSISWLKPERPRNVTRRPARGRLTPEAGAVFMQALAAARETLYQQARATGATTSSEDVSSETPSTAQQQADALTLLAETALHHGVDPGATGERYQVVVHVDAAVLTDPGAPGQSVLEGGTHVSSETSRRLACDASRVVMRHDVDGRIVEVGARTRTIPPALRRALHHRDHGCRFPGCDLPFGQGHHIRHWAQGGPTTLSNLAMLCRRHHRVVHEEGYQVERQPDGELRFRRPDGRSLPDVPPPPAVPDDPIHALRARNEAAGLHLHARTACPGWLGERLDVGRVEGWRGTSRPVSSPRPIERRERISRTPLSCRLSRRGLCDLSRWACFQGRPHVTR